jgi:hypothetical protein
MGKVIKSKHGGRRPNSGQPKKYTLPMVNVTVRVPEIERETVKALELKIRAKYLIKARG